MIPRFDHLNNVGNTNGEVVECKTCREPWENAWIVEEGLATDDVTENQLILAPHHDNPDGEKTRIAGLKWCMCCREID